MSALVELVGETMLRIDPRLSAEELAADVHRAAGVPRRIDDTVVVYLEKDLLLTRPAVLRRVARYVAELVPPGVDRLGSTVGLSLLLGTAVSLEIGLPLVVVDGDAVQGTWYPGEVVTPIEDIVLSGASAETTVRSLRGAGLLVRDVVVAVDRAEGAATRLAANDVALRAVFALPMSA